MAFPDDFKDRIWERFGRYEEHALVMDVAGTGLGLPIVKTLVEMHKGEVWFEIGNRARVRPFSFRLPISREALK